MPISPFIVDIISKFYYDSINTVPDIQPGGDVLSAPQGSQAGGQLLAVVTPQSKTRYCMSQKSWPISYSSFQHKMGQDTQYEAVPIIHFTRPSVGR